MRLFLLSPAFNDAPPDQQRSYLDQLVETLAAALRPTGEESLIGAWHDGEAGMEAEPFDVRHAGKRIRNLTTPGDLRDALRRIADPSKAFFMWVRCQTTCRSVRFGYDGHVFLCLRHEDAPPKSSPLMRIEDCSHLLTQTDYLDG